MPCTRPLTGYWSKNQNPSGKRSIVFNIREAIDDGVIKLPCGQCLDCRLTRSKQWAVRCVHEASQYTDNCFVTLTYRNETLPPGGSLRLSDIQSFFKRLRNPDCWPEQHQKYIHRRKIKYFQCGEYGEKFNRPHHHACIFNLDFPDKYHFSTVNGEKLYRSPILEALWPDGQSLIGAVTFESAAYVARYCTKKITGPHADLHYEKIDQETGEVFDMARERATMSKGIGRDWYEKWKAEVYPSDFIVINGQKLSVPKYYDGRLELENAQLHEDVKMARRAKAKLHADNNTPERLSVREEHRYLKNKKLKRTYES